MKGKSIEISDEKKIDLSGLLISIYGVKYIDHPRLINLTRKNKISENNFLNGDQEAKAFENKDYYKLHLSTLKKTDILANIMNRARSGTLKTNLSWFEKNFSSIEAFLFWMKHHPAYSLMAIVVVLIGFFNGVKQIFHFFEKHLSSFLNYIISFF